MSFELPTENQDLNNLVQMVRLYLRDYPELNRLVDGVENSNRQIIWAIMDAVDDFNTTTPLIQPVGISNYPSRSLLIRGVAIALLESVGLLQTRNHLSFSDGGLQVGINDKTPFIQSWLQLLKNGYEEKKKQLKIAMNIESAWGGGLSSEYRFINNFYGSW